MIRRRFLQAKSVIIIVAALFATVTLGGMLVQRERAELQRRTQVQAQQIATQLQTGMMGAFEPLTRLGSWWLSQGKPFDPEDWRSDAHLFLANATGLRQALWVGSDGVQRWSAVPGSIPATKPVRTNDTIRRLVEDARTRDSRVLSGLFSAPEISQALYVCAPVHRNQRVGLHHRPLRRHGTGFSAGQERVSRDIAVSISAGGRGVYSTAASSSVQEEALARIDLPGQAWIVAAHTPAHYFRAHLR